MNRFEQEYYANINGIAKALDRIADALENNNKEDKIYYKTRKDMFMDNPCTKEEYDATKQENEKLAQNELDAQHDYLHQLVKNLSGKDYAEFCNEHCLPTADSVAVSNYITDLDYDEVLGIISDIEAANEDAIPDTDGAPYDDDYDLRCTAKMYTEELKAGNFNTKKECILDYITNEFGSHGARYTDIIKFAYYLGEPNAPKFGYNDRGYYSCAISGRNAHLIQGGKDYLVKGINKEGNERYFALSFVESATSYWKYIEGGTHGYM
jgi:hypothetical protein